MWAAKVKICGEKGLLGNLAKKYNVSVVGYPISIKKKLKFIVVDALGLLFGKDNNKKNFIKELKKAKEVKNIEITGDFIIMQVIDPKELEPAYPSGIISLEPIVIESNGDNIYSVGSWDRKELNNFINFLYKKYRGKVSISKIENRKISNFSIVSLRPELTDKQKEAFDLAIKNGYYNYPRKTSVEKLAKISGVSFSAFHAHLRKAEKKLLHYSPYSN